MSLYHEVYQGSDFSEDHYYEAIRYVMGQEYAEYIPQELEELLLEHLDGMTEDQAENVFKKLGNIAKGIAKGALKVATVAAPIAGKVVGGMFGGPMGVKVGAALGNTVGQFAQAGVSALSSQKGQAKTHLNKAWQTAKNEGFNLAQQAIPSVQNYIQQNPNAGFSKVVNNTDIQRLYALFGQLMQSPQLQAAQMQQELGTAPPDMPVEGFSYAEMIEATHYLTESILAELHENYDYGRENIYYDRHGQMRFTNPSMRNEKANYLIESII